MAAAVLIAVVVWPLIPGVPYDYLNTAFLSFQYTIVAVSLVLLIGLVGQISLAQASFVGIGAFVGALTTLHLGVRFPVTLLVGTAAGAGLAMVIGVVALRVRGLYLAVATLIFAFVADRYLFAQIWLVPTPSGVSIPSETIGRPGTIPYFNLADGHVFYYAGLATALIALYGVANIRDSRVGRAFAAIRGSEVAAASLGINVTRFKLLAFACSGALAGLGGALILVGQRTVAPGQFSFMNSLFYLSVAVVGGLRSLGGAVVSALLFALLVGEVFFHYPALANYLDLISAATLVAVLLFFREGLGALPGRVQAWWGGGLSAVGRRMPRRPAATVSATPSQPGGLSRALARFADVVTAPLASVGRLVSGTQGGTAAEPVDVLALVDHLLPPKEANITALPERHESDSDSDLRRLLEAAEREHRVAGEEGTDGRRQPWLLQASDITVRFGGLTAVNGASLSVGAGEIVGLIGPNGAGKTTLFNSILGLNQPAAGSVSLYGHDVGGWDVHQRAALGVGRTFQVLQLFGNLSVFDNLLVATHLQNRTGLFGALAVTAGARRAERAARARVHAVLRLMELEQYSHRLAAGLPFGVLRQIEVARTLVTGAKLVCFDEPASGLDSRETERLIEWLQLLRRIGVSLLVIEHDVDMVVRLCDYIYVLDQGRLIASGTPSQIQRDPAVIASYLGSAEAA
ncbi:MAG: branched-chain amino acid ABC transporter ATP-binding protein/permease [Candidatus Dormibacteria bacterium]